MKLRIRGNSVRLRLTRSEVAKFAEYGSIEDETNFGSGQKLVYALVAADELREVRAAFMDGRIEVHIPKHTATSWAGSDEVGIASTDGDLRITVEKDFNCLTPRGEEEDGDTFEHPKNRTAC